MFQYVKLSLILFLLTFTICPHAVQADGGVVVRPYWSFRTEAPVSHVQSGDINGDGLPEVVILTTNNVVYVLDNAGNIVWRHEVGLAAHNLLVADLDGDPRTAEIFVGGRGEGVMLTNSEKPAWYWRRAAVAITTVNRAADLNGDGRPEIIIGGDTIVAIDPAIGGHYATDWQSSDTRGMASRPVRDLWLGDLDGDGRPEVLPSVNGGDTIYRLQDTDFDQIWQRSLDTEVGLVQAGNVVGDTPAEIAVLTADWQLILLNEQGHLLWQRPLLPPDQARLAPAAGQFLVTDLAGDPRAEILVLTPAPLPELAAFNSQGEPLWSHPLPPGDQPGRLLAADLTGDGQSEILVAAIGGEQLFLLAASGQLLAAYHTRGPLTSVATADLNHDGQSEIIAGTGVGVQLFGASAKVAWQERWQSPSLGMTRVNALNQADLNNDGRSETLAALQSGWLFALTDDGRIVWDVDLGGSIQTVAAADVDGDGRPEILAGTTSEGGQLQLLDGDRPRWSGRANAISQVITPDLDGDGRAEIVVRAGTTRGQVQRFNNSGQRLWQQRFDEPVTAIGSDGAHILVGTAGGRVHRLTADGRSLSVIELGAEVIGFSQGMATTAAGRLFQLNEQQPPRLLQELGQSPLQAQPGDNATALLAGGRVRMLANDGTSSPVDVEGQVTALAAGPNDVVVLGTDRGKVHQFGLTLDQPPLLTNPDLNETREGYAYGVTVNDPDRNPVKVTLEVWNPSADAWLAFEPQTTLEPGRLVWAGLAPFDTWDSGAESRFRFVYHDGHTARVTAEIPGPLTIPTAPWYIFYGQRLVLGLITLFAAMLGWWLYRRRQAYRRSPVGQAEALLKELQARPHTALRRLHQLARTDPTQLTMLTGLAREANQPHLARLSEGFQLLVTQPDLAVQGVQAILETGAQLPPEPAAETLLGRYAVLRQALQANTTTRIVALRPRLTTEPETELTAVIQPLANFQRVDTLADKVAYLGQALETLGRLERETIAALPQPEQNIFRQIATAWLLVTNNALQDLQGRAELAVTLKTRQLLKLEQATLSLEVTNRGRSPASNISVSLAPDQPFAVSNGRARLELLPAGRSATVELPIACANSVEHVRAEFLLTYDDRERTGKSLAFADMVQLLRPAAEFRFISNPYAPGTPLAPHSPIFFGRDDLFRFIAENLAGLARQNILVLIGQRRMGKTSFLQQLPARLGGSYLPVYIDGQSLGIDPGMGNFFYDMALAVVDALAEAGIDLEEPEPADYQERPSGVFERAFLPAVFRAIGQRQLLLLFDEFEELEMRVTSGKLDRTIFPFFRHLMQHHRQLGFIFVGTHKLESLSADYWSIFFNIALYKHVTFLDENAARALITQPVAEAGLLYDDLALDKMVRVTAGQPYFLQLTCHALVNRANRERRGYVTIQDVNSVLEEMVELGEAHFAFLWEQAGPDEQLVLAALTRLLDQTPTSTAAQVAEALAKRGVQLTARKVSEALRRLVERDVVREIQGQPPRYEYKVELVRLWVERYKALGRVIELYGS